MKLKNTFVSSLALVVALAGPAFAVEGTEENVGAAETVSDATGPEVTEADQNQGVGIIVVTAQRREQNLQDVPLAVSAISSENLVRQQATTTQSLIRLFPNLSGGQVTGAGSANNYSMRGLYNSETAATFDSPVGTYVDGIYMARLNASNFGLFDVERIEVLRGPQGTLFGRNTTGGAINVVLRKPGSELGGFVEGELGNYDHYQVRGAIDLPLSPSIRTRLAAYKMGEDGWAKNVSTGGSNNDHDGWGVRGAVSIDLSPAVTWDASADYTEDFNENIPVRKVNGDWVTRSGLTRLGDLVIGKKGNIPGNFVGNYSYGITSSLKIEAAIGDIEFITGYRHLKSRYNIDYFDNPAVIGGYDSVQYSTHEQFSQEAKVSGTTFNDLLGYTVGLFYFHEKNVTDYTTVFRLGSGAPFVDADRVLFNDVDSMAAYGQFDFHVTPELTLTAGARWTTERKDVHYENNGNPLAVFSITDTVLLNAGIPLKQEVNVLTPRFALQYEPTDDVMLFASSTRGFKSGGWNVRGTNAATLSAFLPEKIWSYEAGIRSEFLDRRLRVNLTGFYGDTTDLQIATAVVIGSMAPQFPTGNFADFESYGAELEVNFVPVAGLNIFANGGWNETNYKSPTAAVLAQQTACLASIEGAAASRPNCGAGIVRVDGTLAEPARAPKYTATIGFSWELPITDSWQIVPAASGRYVSKFNTNSAELANAQDDGYFMISGSLAVENVDRNLQFSVGCENCNNTSYLLSVIGGNTFYNPPRRLYLRARLGF